MFVLFSDIYIIYNASSLGSRWPCVHWSATICSVRDSWKMSVNSTNSEGHYRVLSWALYMRSYSSCIKPKLRMLYNICTFAFPYIASVVNSSSHIWRIGMSQKLNKVYDNCSARLWHFTNGLPRRRWILLAIRMTPIAHSQDNSFEQLSSGGAISITRTCSTTRERTKHSISRGIEMLLLRNLTIEKLDTCTWRRPQNLFED